MVKLRTSIVKKANVPTKVTTLFKSPEFIPTILLVAAAINVMLVIIRNVATESSRHQKLRFLA